MVDQREKALSRVALDVLGDHRVEGLVHEPRKTRDQRYVSTDVNEEHRARGHRRIPELAARGSVRLGSLSVVAMRFREFEVQIVPADCGAVEVRD